MTVARPHHQPVVAEANRLRIAVPRTMKHRENGHGELASVDQISTTTLTHIGSINSLRLVRSASVIGQCVELDLHHETLFTAPKDHTAQRRNVAVVASPA